MFLGDGPAGLGRLAPGPGEALGGRNPRGDEGHPWGARRAEGVGRTGPAPARGSGLDPGPRLSPKSVRAPFAAGGGAAAAGRGGEGQAGEAAEGRNRVDGSGQEQEGRREADRAAAGEGAGKEGWRDATESVRGVMSPTAGGERPGSQARASPAAPLGGAGRGGGGGERRRGADDRGRTAIPPLQGAIGADGDCRE